MLKRIVAGRLSGVKVRGNTARIQSTLHHQHHALNTFLASLKTHPKSARLPPSLPASGLHVLPPGLMLPFHQGSAGIPGSGSACWGGGGGGCGGWRFPVEDVDGPTTAGPASRVSDGLLEEDGRSVRERANSLLVPNLAPSIRQAFLRDPSLTFSSIPAVVSHHSLDLLMLQVYQTLI